MDSDSALLAVILPTVVVTAITVLFLTLVIHEGLNIKKGKAPRKVLRTGLFVYSGGILNGMIIINSLIVFVSPGEHYHGLSLITNLAVLKSIFDYGLLTLHWYEKKKSEDKEDKGEI